MKKFKIELNEQQLSVLNVALIEMPFKIAAPIIMHINAEIQKVFDKSIDDKESNSIDVNP